MPGFAKRLERAAVAPTVALTVRARELRAAGADVVTLTIGEPDFATPPHAIEAAHAAALQGDTKYPPMDGTRALKQAVQRKYTREHGLQYGLDQVVVGNGGKQVIYDALLATVEDGDEVLIPTPFWSAYALMTHIVGGTPTYVSCPQNNGFKLRPDDLDAAITPRTRWLFLNFPNNPSGAACSRDELAALGAVMLKHPHVWILSDDMYEHLVYDGFERSTLAAVEPRLADRILTVSGVSKTYAMTGWRIGFGVGPKNLIGAMGNTQGQVTAGVSTVGQAAAAAALDGPQDMVAESRESYRRRRDLVVDRLNAISGITCHRPEGAFYVFPDIAGCLGRTSAGGRRIDTDEDFAVALLEEQHVATVFGAAFGMSPYLRISYATDVASLEEGCRRVAQFVARPAVIRAAEDSDAAGITAVVGACWGEYPGCVTDVAGESPELLAIASHCASRGGAAWVAEEDDQIVGLSCTYPWQDSVWEIAKIYVARAQRGSGIAAGLIERAEGLPARTVPRGQDCGATRALIGRTGSTKSAATFARARSGRWPTDRTRSSSAMPSR